VLSTIIPLMLNSPELEVEMSISFAVIVLRVPGLQCDLTTGGSVRGGAGGEHELAASAAVARAHHHVTIVPARRGVTCQS
jgi:hypothetical protein